MELREFGTYYLYLQIMERITMKTRHIEMVTKRTRNADISENKLSKFDIFQSRLSIETKNNGNVLAYIHSRLQINLSVQKRYLLRYFWLRFRTTSELQMNGKSHQSLYSLSWDRT